MEKGLIGELLDAAGGDTSVLEDIALKGMVAIHLFRCDKCQRFSDYVSSHEKGTPFIPPNYPCLIGGTLFATYVFNKHG